MKVVRWLTVDYGVSRAWASEMVQSLPHAVTNNFSKSWVLFLWSRANDDTEEYTDRVTSLCLMASEVGKLGASALKAIRLPTLLKQKQ